MTSDSQVYLATGEMEVTLSNKLWMHRIVPSLKVGPGVADVPFSDEGKGDLQLMGNAEPLTRWQREIRAMHGAVEEWKAGNLSLAQSVVNRHMRGRVSPWLLWDEERTSLDVRVVPGSLLGALWLQFAQAIGGNKKYRACQECGKWFEFDPDKARREKVFCSNACRNRAWRRSQKISAEA